MLKYKCAILKLPRTRRTALQHTMRFLPPGLAALTVCAALWQTAAQAPVTPQENAASVTVADDSTSPLPVLLSAQDRSLYHQLFDATKEAQWARADLITAKISNKLLLGHALAARYLSHHYESNPAELADWLNNYGDHPEAADIYALAVTKTPSFKHDLPQPHKQTALNGFGDDNGLSHPVDSPITRSWQKAIGAWKAGHTSEAAKLFSGLLKDDNQLSPWTQSAAAYWSWRAYNALGDKAQAAKYLQMAAREPRSFYGILARRQLGLSLGLDAEPVALTQSDILEMIGEPAIKRVIALSESNLVEQAENEIRALFPQSDENEKLRLLSLAHTLNLASVQISMAKQLSDESHTMDFARYPVPQWQPKNGFTIDPALIYALARQESGFNVSAVSPGGALGLMQLMPQTASQMQRHMPTTGVLVAANVSEPVMNITLGQNYIKHLMGDELVGNNLIYLLAAYNAGPGRLQEWKQTLGSNDPLLFLESIPMRETRNYTMQVLTNYWIYSELQGSPSRSVAALISGKWPSYDRAAGMAAARLAMDKAG